MVSCEVINKVVDEVGFIIYASEIYEKARDAVWFRVGGGRLLASVFVRGGGEAGVNLWVRSKIGPRVGGWDGGGG